MRPPYKPKKWETVNCPFCNAEQKRLYEKYGDRFQYTYVSCSNCSLVYQSPRPKYDQDFLSAAYGDYLEFDDEYDYSSEDLFQFSEEAKEIIQFDKKRSRILDVGSCLGNFLHVMMPYYQDVEGIEIAENMASYSEKKLGIKIYRDQFEDFETDKKYSCIHMSHVIEHIPNPVEWMKKAHELLDDEGFLVICVPNIRSIGRQMKYKFKKIGLRNGRWKESWRTPDHLFEPSITSMKYLSTRNGFEVVNIYTYSRKDPIAEKWYSKIIQRQLRIGSNLRIYLRKIA